MNQFFAALSRRWVEGAARMGVRIAAPDLDAAVAEELLQLARVVAHSKERSFAPLASFTAGIAAERLRVAKGTASTAEVASYIRTIREGLERETLAG